MEPFIPGRGGLDTMARTGGHASFLRALLERLVASENALLVAMARAGLPIAPAPAAAPASADLELGVVLFLLNHPDRIEDTTLRFLADAFAILVAKLGVPLPPTRIAPAQYALLGAHRVVDATDGSLLGTGAYELYDQRWLGAFFNLVRSVIEGVFAPDASPASASPTIVAPRDGRVTVALVSDWGTGDKKAAITMAAIIAKSPDLIIHLGDVYYAGTPAHGGFQPPGEENANLLAPWPAAWRGRSFALNSNHEMYSGALGYQAALADPIFSAQDGRRQFQLRIGDWTILGLDTATAADPASLYLHGRLGTDQCRWIGDNRPEPSRTVVLTHHNALAIDLDPAAQALCAPLWSELRTALGADPAAWYWGHIHNGVVYADPVSVGPDFTTTTRARCLGHGALPCGFASALADHPAVAWQASTADPDGIGAELANGFVLLDFTVDADNKVAALTEFFFDTAGPEPRWRGVLTPPAAPAAAPPAPARSAAAAS